MGGFTTSPSPFPQASGDKGDHDGSSDGDADEDDGASSSGANEMST